MHRIKVDLHMHTNHSPDATLSPGELVASARAAGLSRIAVTDHNAIDGAKRAAELDPELVIVGEEIDCAGGTHLIGLFLKERIPPGLQVEESAERIHEQGGLVYAPHPFAYMSKPGGRARSVLAVADVVEVHNARAFLPVWNRRAAEAARAAGLPGAAGTDAHFAREIGSAYTELPAFTDADSLRAALRHARPCIVRNPVALAHVRSLSIHFMRYATGRLKSE